MGRDSGMAQQRTGRAPAVTRRERAALVGLIAGRSRRLEAERSLDDLAGLADAAGADVVLRVLQERPRPDPSTFLGAGKIETLAASAAETGVDVVIFDSELTPAQLRQIEEEVGRKIIDRTQLILDIFARRARTREGKLQVELAQLKYLLPRLVGAGDALSRLGGGIDRLPHALVAAFRAALEETSDADLVLHVIDAAAPDRERRIAAVRQVLDEVDAADVPMVEVYNKCDALTPDERRRLTDLDPSALCISALTGEGVDEIVETMTSRLALDVQRVTLSFDPDDPADRDRIARL